MNERNFIWSGAQVFWLVFLRLAIGWHFLYEGLTKITKPGWSARGYLMDSQGPFSELFHTMARNTGMLQVINLLNQWGLVLIGLGLILGFFSRWAAYAGMLLLALYYLSHPPLIGVIFSLPTEGNYFLIDKVAVEFFALAVLSAFPTDDKIGLGQFLLSYKA
jgi:thiosulfate dehydrogenase [quinone] large subunit